VIGPPAGAAAGRLRLLVVAYYFPPAGGAGVQRALKWVKYLPAHGIDPVVLTVRAGAYPQLDPTLAAEVPAGVSVHRTPAPDPFGLYGRLTRADRDRIVATRTDDVGSGGGVAEGAARWLRANVFLPDARVGWVPFAAWRGARLSRQRGIDALLTTGPPHSAHLAGLAIRRAGRLPWVADFRDPWTDIHYYRDLPRTRLAARLDGVPRASGPPPGRCRDHGQPVVGRPAGGARRPPRRGDPQRLRPRRFRRRRAAAPAGRRSR
jgi:hypothetical protein